MKAIKFTEEQIQELRDFIASGVTQTEATEKFGVSASKLVNICKENNIERKWFRKCTCTVCGKEFKSPSATIICPECKATPAKCVICGKEFKRVHPYTQKTCSTKCRGEYRAQSGVAKAGAAKMKETKLEKYGTLDPAEVAKQRNGGQLPAKICPLCNKEFIPNTPRQIYCTDTHYGPCPVCGKLTEIKDYTIGPQACSDKCRVARINATCLDKYGNKDAVNSEHAKELARQHSLERYGKEYYHQTDEAKERVKKTNQERYGTDNPMQNKEIQEKAKATNLEKYGVEYASQRPEFHEKFVATMEERYGGVGLGSPELREQIIETNKERYGADYPIQNPEVKQKAVNTLRDKYQVDNFWKSEAHLAQIIKDPSKAKQFYEFKQDPKKYVSEHYTRKPTAKELSIDLGVSDTPIYDALLRTDNSDIIADGKTSTMEYQVQEFLRSILPDGTKIVHNTRRIISPLELDFYLPEYNFAIECNPTETHQSSVPGMYNAEPLPYNYHQKKSLACKEKGIFLFHIFGYEWTHRRDIIESMITNALGYSSHRYYARDTQVVEIESAAASRFLDANHRQGSCPCSIRLGLQHKKTGEIISIMTFGKTRPSIGRQNATENSWELIRFCNLLNTSVVGGASKLFKYFVANYANGSKIISFSDVAHTRGNLYPTLGFNEISRSGPGYVWVKQYYDTYRNRVSCQKSNLIRMFEDVTDETIANHSEREIMIGHGYVQVFDSGVIRWEYTP